MSWLSKLTGLDDANACHAEAVSNLDATLRSKGWTEADIGWLRVKHWHIFYMNLSLYHVGDKRSYTTYKEFADDVAGLPPSKRCQ